MLSFLKKEAAKTYTENGAVTCAATMSDCLDLFATIGALHKTGEAEIIHRFTRAYAEDPDIAMRILFFARDVRGGLGERRVFRIILRHLAYMQPQSVVHNLENVPQYGRYDDLLSLMGTACQTPMVRLIQKQLQNDWTALCTASGSVSLLAKWLPSVNASNPQTVKTAKQLAKLLGISQSAYRKMLARLRRQIAILENNLRLRDYTFSYEAQPSKAMMKYRKAFLRNDCERYHAFVQSVKKGKAVLHTGALFPYEIIAPCLHSPHISENERSALDVTWNSLPDYTKYENALVVVDGSGSMYWNTSPSPACVALSLGIYFAQRNWGIFHNHFITFSESPPSGGNQRKRSV